MKKSNPSILKLIQKYSLGCLAFTLALSGCRTPASASRNQQLSTVSAKQYSVDLRKDTSVDIDNINKDISQWLTSEAGKAAFFSNQQAVSDSVPAQRSDFSLIIEALAVQSRLAATQGNESRAKNAIKVALSTTEKIMAIAPPKANDYPLSIMIPPLTFAEIEREMGKYPTSAKSWAWYSPTLQSVKTAKSHLKVIKPQIAGLIHASPAASVEQWQALSNRAKAQAMSDIASIRRNLN